MVGTANLQSLFPTLSASFPQRTPVDWTNNETQLSAANLNTLTTNIVYNRTTLGSVISSVNSALTTISSRNAGWRALDSSGSYALGEIFNDYEKNKATAPFSHSEGEGTIAYETAQHVQGKWNESPSYDGSGRLTNPYAHIIGGGSSDSNRFNIHTVDWDGNAWYKGDVQANIKRDGADYVASFTDAYAEFDAKTDALNRRCDAIIGAEDTSTAGDDSLWGMKRYVDERDTEIKALLSNIINATVPDFERRLVALEKISHEVLSGTGTPDNNKGNDGDVYIKLVREE